jgi:HD-like signal output (HDOD) protein
LPHRGVSGIGEAHMNEKLIDRILHCPDLPSLPAAALEVLKLTRDETVHLNEIAAAVSRDPALATKLLRTVNSSFYGHSQAITTIRHGVVFLGIQSVKTLVLGFTILNEIAKKAPKSFDYMDYWKRSLYAATAARALAARLLETHEDTCFLAGLLMDIGMLVFDRVLGDDYGEICARARNHQELPVFERKALGMTHGDAIAALADHWKLPSLLAVPMAAHHEPQKIEDETEHKLALIVHLASRCADIFVDQRPAMCISEVRRLCMELYSIREIECDAMLCSIGMKTRELAPLFEVHTGDMEDYEAILKRANEELLALTLDALESHNPTEKRRAPRVKKDNAILIIPCNAGILQAPLSVRLRDVSSRGVGISSQKKIEKGSQFIIQLPQKQGKPISILYNVVRCTFEKDLYIVGAQMECILNSSQVPAKPDAARGALARISEAVLS